MGREIDVQKMVPLPKTTGARASALGKAMKAAAEPLLSQLSPQAACYLDELNAGTMALEEAMAMEVAAPALSPPEADQGVDHGWGSLADVVNGRADAVKESPARAAARLLRSSLFPDGMGWLKADFKTEHEESARRIKLLEAPELKAAVAAIHAGDLVGEILEAHAVYGRVLGITAPVEGEAPPAVRVARDALLASIREYVVRVLALEAPTLPGSAELVAALLQPLTSWEDV